MKAFIETFLNSFAVSPSTMRFENKAIIVTGAGSGIGREIALSFGREGGKVTVSDIIVESAEKVAGEIKSAGGEAIAVKTDVANDSEVEEMVKKTLDEFGSVDVLVNNAAWWPVKYFVQQTQEECDKKIKIIY